MMPILILNGNFLEVSDIIFPVLAAFENQVTVFCFSRPAGKVVLGTLQQPIKDVTSKIEKDSTSQSMRCNLFLLLTVNASEVFEGQQSTTLFRRMELSLEPGQ